MTFSAVQFLGAVSCAFIVILPKAVVMDQVWTMSPFDYWAPQRCTQCGGIRYAAGWEGLSRPEVSPNHLQCHTRWGAQRMPLKAKSNYSFSAGRQKAVAKLKMFHGIRVAWKLLDGIQTLRRSAIQMNVELPIKQILLIINKRSICKSHVIGDQYSASENWELAQSIYDFTVNDIHGNPVSLSKYKGHVLLIVNVASRCGLTANNYRQLVELHDMFHDSKGLRILAFPCNQFGGQEPGTNEDIICFAKNKNAHFDFFDKVKVNGEDAHPLWKYLKKEQKGTLGDLIKWNFTKFIVDKNGKVVERHGPSTDPLKLVSSLEKYF